MSLRSKLSVVVNATHSSTLDLGAGTVPLALTYAKSLANGTGAGQADKLFHDRRTLAASATEDIDLAGVLADAFGSTITFARVKGLVIAAASGNTNNVIVGAAAANPWTALLGATGTVTLRPDAVFAVLAGEADATGYAVTAGTGDLLKVANSGAGSSVTYDIVIIGASA
jgi:hypothetical protein